MLAVRVKVKFTISFRVGVVIIFTLPTDFLPLLKLSRVLTGSNSWFSVRCRVIRLGQTKKKCVCFRLYAS